MSVRSMSCRLSPAGRGVPFVGVGGGRWSGWVRGSSPAPTKAGNSSRVLRLLRGAPKGVK